MDNKGDVKRGDVKRDVPLCPMLRREREPENRDVNLHLSRFTYREHALRRQPSRLFSVI